MKQPIMLFLCLLLLEVSFVRSLESYRIFVSSLTPESDVRVGSKGEGIYIFDLKEKSDGSISFTRTNTILDVNSAINTAMTNSGKYLYAATFSPTFVGSQIHAFRISENVNTRPAVIGSWPVGQIEPIQLVVDAKDRFLFAAMYNGNAASAFQIDPDTGGLYMKNLYEFPNPTNITHDAGPHHVLVDKKLRYVYFGGLNHDCIWRFNYSVTTGFDSDSLKIYPAESGCGVRSLVFDPINENYLYVSCEHSNHVLVYKVDTNGDLQQLQYESMPLANSTIGTRTADIQVSPNGRFIYVSCRLGPNTIAVFQVLNDGKVKLVQEINSGGLMPNHVVVIPNLNLVLVANQDSDDITAFRSSPQNGTLTKMDHWAVNAPENMQVISLASTSKLAGGHREHERESIFSNFHERESNGH